MVDELLGVSSSTCQKPTDAVVVHVDGAFGVVCAICDKAVDPFHDSRRYFTCPACKKTTPPMHLECALTTNARHRGGDPLACSVTEGCSTRLDIHIDTTSMEKILSFHPASDVLHKGVSVEIDPVVDAVESAVDAIRTCFAEIRETEVIPIENAPIFVIAVNACMYTTVLFAYLLSCLISTDIAEFIPFMVFACGTAVGTGTLAISQIADRKVSTPRRPRVVATWMGAFIIALIASLFGSTAVAILVMIVYPVVVWCLVVDSAGRLCQTIPKNIRRRMKYVCRIAICIGLAGRLVELLKARIDADAKKPTQISAIEYERSEHGAANGIEHYDNVSYEFTYLPARYGRRTLNEKCAMAILVKRAAVGWDK